MTTALEQNREDAALGAAWRRCEAALPEGWELALVNTPGRPNYYARCERQGVGSHGPTPTAALEALAVKLEGLP